MPPCSWCHPDDIEIGAGALVTKAISLGFAVFMIILTDDSVNPSRRRAEARLAAAELGVPRSNVLFGGLVDGHLRADGGSVQRLRDLLTSAKIRPGLVVTHTQADSHNDHVEAHRITHAAIRDGVFLHFSIHVSCEPDRFAPKVFIDVSEDRLEVKDRALMMHQSQSGRIGRHDLSKYEARLGRFARLERAEAFELAWQYDASSMIYNALRLSDSPFHRLWAPIIREATVTLLYEETGYYGEQSEVHLNVGRDRLRAAFVDYWAPVYPLREQYANTSEALSIARERNVIVTGPPSTNRVVRELYNQLQATRWIFEDDRSAGYAPLVNRETGERLYPELDAEEGPGVDVGVLARVANAFKDGSTLMYAGGGTSFGVRRAMEFLADPGTAPNLADAFLDGPSAEVAFTVDRTNGSTEVSDIVKGQ